MSQGRVNSLSIPSPLQRFQPLRTKGKHFDTVRSVPWEQRTVVLVAEKAPGKCLRYSCAEGARASQCAEAAGEGLESPTPTRRTLNAALSGLGGPACSSCLHSAGVRCQEGSELWEV